MQAVERKRGNATKLFCLCVAVRANKNVDCSFCLCGVTYFFNPGDMYKLTNVVCCGHRYRFRSLPLLCSVLLSTYVYSIDVYTGELLKFIFAYY